MRVLLATDGSTWAARALETIMASFEPDRVEVLVLTAVAGDASDPPTHVTEAVRTLESSGFRAVPMVVAGHPAEVILRASEDRRCDLVAMGTRGLNAAARVFAGSVSTNVVRHSSVPVIVAVDGRPLRRIVLGVDGSPDARDCLAVVAGLPLRTSPGIVATTAFDVAYPFQSGITSTMRDAIEADFEQELRRAEHHARAVANSAVHQLAAGGMAAAAMVRRGHPADVLIAVADEVDADLVAVGSRGLSGIRRFFLGSTSAALLGHPGRNVLVTKHADPTGVAMG